MSGTFVERGTQLVTSTINLTRRIGSDANAAKHRINSNGDILVSRRAMRSWVVMRNSLP
ncbi:MAG: hypothetical protein WCH96_00700 [Betaproteobacteria bacterium]